MLNAAESSDIAIRWKDSHQTRLFDSILQNQKELKGSLIKLNGSYLWPNTPPLLRVCYSVSAWIQSNYSMAFFNHTMRKEVTAYHLEICPYHSNSSLVNWTHFILFYFIFIRFETFCFTESMVIYTLYIVFQMDSLGHRWVNFMLLSLIRVTKMKFIWSRNMLPLLNVPLIYIALQYPCANNVVAMNKNMQLMHVLISHRKLNAYCSDLLWNVFFRNRETYSCVIFVESKEIWYGIFSSNNWNLWGK